MAGSFVPFGLNLQIQSGVPLAKVASVFMEKLSVVKRMDGGSGGGVGGLLQQVVSGGGLAGIMQNPMAALTGAVQGQLGGLVSQLQGMVGGGPSALISALAGASGLGNAMSVFQAAGDNLAGLVNGAQGFMQMIGHASTVDLAGAALPQAAAMSEVTGPLASRPFLSDLANQLPAVINNVVGGAQSASDATNWVQAQIMTAASIVASSAGALAWSEQMHAPLAVVSTVGGALAVPSTFDAAGNRQEGAATGFQGLLSTLVHPDAREALDGAMREQLAGMPSIDTPEQRADIISALQDVIDKITSLEG